MIDYRGIEQRLAEALGLRRVGPPGRLLARNHARSWNCYRVESSRSSRPASPLGGG
jgi:hypothetical protein